MRRRGIALASLGVLIAVGILAATWREASDRPKAAPGALEARAEDKLDSTIGDEPRVAAEDSVERGATIESTLRDAEAARLNERASESSRETTLVVSIVAKETSKPVADARVRLAVARDGAWDDVAFADDQRGSIALAPRTGAAGVVVLDAPPDAPLVLSVWREHPDGGGDELDVAPLARGERRELSVPIAIYDDMLVRGRVVDASGAPVAGATIQVGQHARINRRKNVESLEHAVPLDRFRRDSATRSDFDGAFISTGASWRQSELRVDAAGFARRTIHLDETSIKAGTAVVVTLEPGASLDVHVVDRSGVGVAGVIAGVAVARPRSATTRDWETLVRGREAWTAVPDQRGVVRLHGLPVGEPLEVCVRRDATTLRRTTPPITLHAGETRSVDVSIGDGTRVDVLAIEADGSPATTTRVWLVDARGRRNRMLSNADDPARVARTDAQGRASFDDVPAGLWLVGMATGASAATRTVLAEIVELDGGELAIDVTLTVYAGGIVRGIVLDRDDRPVAGADLTVANVELGFEVAGQSGENGRFAIGPLAPIPLELACQPPRGSAPREPMLVRAGDDVVVRVEPGGTLRAELVDASGKRVNVAAEIEATLLGADPHSARGRWCAARQGVAELLDLPPGTWDVVARAPDGSTGIGRVDVRAGDTAELVLALAAGGWLLVRNSSAPATIRVLAGETVIAHRTIDDDVTLAVPVGEIVVEIMPAGFHLVSLPEEIEVKVVPTPGERTVHRVTIAVGGTSELSLSSKR